MLANALYGVLGKNNFSGYHYHPFMLTVNHIAILKTYYLYRQFKPEQFLAIRSNCIYVQGKLPKDLETELYHLEKIKLFGTQVKSNVFNFDQGELKSFANDQARNELIEWFEKQNL